ncbi:histidine kinase dimerization/phosphoacceptor domain -containing protein [Flectobacillus roseus]|uniref:histidine kinase n=1 Tax=Flectobacillus roseus TaxID=502259 RepID=A0ABT6Y2Q1_9BACT|nr:histidine kinase dimerization/phosphoacceptor domain -containing protein [Flectobacillus roseus]MDI9857826.1 histidine kinase dimerization/phosphoacceptor domain -containing protein [Flectobacillus roseus]
MNHIKSLFVFLLLFFLGIHPKAQSLESVREKWNKLPANEKRALAIYQFSEKGELEDQVKRDILLEAIDLIPENSADTLLGHLHYKLGETNYGLEDYVKSLEHFNKALHRFQEQKNLYWVGTTYIQLGNVFERQNRLDEAERMYVLTQKIGKDLHNDKLIAYSYNSLSIIYDKRGQSQKALDLSIIGLKYLKSAEMSDDYLSGLVNIGIHYKNLGQFDKAIQKYQEALSLEITQKDVFSLAAIYINLAWAYNGKKAYKEGITSAQKGIEYANNIPERKYFQADAYDVLAKLYEGEKKWDKAYYAYKNHVVLNDSITNLEIKSKVVELEERNKTIEKETQIKELNFQNTAKQNIIFFGLILIAVLVIAGFLLIRKNRIIHQNNDLLTSQNYKIQEQSDKLVLMMKELHHRVKNNLSIVASLLNLQTYGLTDQDAIKAVQTGQKRVEAMSLIHQKLYQTSHTTALNIKEYITDLVENIMESYGYTRQNFNLLLDIEQTEIDVDLAIPIGLILNELVTNSFKYAYQQVPDPTLEIKFKTEGGIYLKVKDNGAGIDMDKWNSKGRRSFGKQLIISLSKQVSGQYKVENDGGAVFELAIAPNQEAA